MFDFWIIRFIYDKVRRFYYLLYFSEYFSRFIFWFLCFDLDFFLVYIVGWEFEERGLYRYSSYRFLSVLFIVVLFIGGDSDFFLGVEFFLLVVVGVEFYFC